MSNPNQYPASVAEILDDNMKFNRAALAALRAFKASRPWRGSLDERHRKFRTAHDVLCVAYRIDPPPRLIFGNDHVTCSGRSCFIPAMNTIVLRGRLSVTTYLHEIAHARGMNERAATRFSVNAFRKVWPRLFARCRHDGHILRAPVTPQEGKE